MVAPSYFLRYTAIYYRGRATFDQTMGYRSFIALLAKAEVATQEIVKTL
jgi:hypothetical protein